MQPPQRKSARSSLVADGPAHGSAEAVDEAADRLLRRLDPADLGLAADRWQGRSDDRELVDIEAHPQTYVGGFNRGDNVRHGWSSIRMRHWPLRSLTTARLTRELANAEGQLIASMLTKPTAI